MANARIAPANRQPLPPVYEVQSWPTIRSKAVEYARKYWTMACSDGYIAVSKTPFFVSVPTGTMFEQKIANGEWTDEWAKKPDGSVIPWKDLDDCTHFVSCCLGKPPHEDAGGLAIHQDFNTIYGRLSAARLFDNLKSDGLIQIIAERQTLAEAEALLGQLQAGDLIFYCKSQQDYHHSAIYLAGTKQRVACHTYCRCDVTDLYPQKWNDTDYTNCTLVKVL